MRTLFFDLVYQNGIANLFQGSPTGPVRVYQGDYHTAIAMARGCGLAGGIVRTFAADVLGDCMKAQWSLVGAGQPFEDKRVDLSIN